MKHIDPLFSMAQELRKLNTELASFSETGCIVPALSSRLKSFTVALTYGSAPMSIHETFAALKTMAAFGKLQCLQFLNLHISADRKAELAGVFTSMTAPGTSAPIPGPPVIQALLPELVALEQSARARATV